MLRKIQNECPTHRQSGDEDLFAPAGQRLIRLFRVANPVCVPNLVDVLPPRPVTGQAWSLNGEPFRCKLLSILANAPDSPRESLNDETTSAIRSFRAEWFPLFVNVHFPPPFPTDVVHTNSITGNPDPPAMAWTLWHPGLDAASFSQVFSELSSIPSEEHASRSMAAR